MGVVGSRRKKLVFKRECEGGSVAESESDEKFSPRLNGPERRKCFLFCTRTMKTNSLAR